MSLVLVGLAWIATTCAVRPNRCVIKNRSGASVRQVTVTLTGMGTPLVKSFPVLAPGETETFGHGLNDSAAVLEFVDGEGIARRHETPYIDLWTGEGWVFCIRADGVVDEGYDYADLAPE